jgi:hypothetical protein
MRLESNLIPLWRFLKPAKRARLEAAGWKVGTVQDFLDLSDAELAITDIRLQLSNQLRKRRAKSGITQAKLATLLESSQSRVAKMEAGG